MPHPHVHGCPQGIAGRNVDCGRWKLNRRRKRHCGQDQTAAIYPPCRHHPPRRTSRHPTDPSRPGPVRIQSVPSSQAAFLTATPDPPNHGTRVSKRRPGADWFSSVVAQGPLPVHARVQRCWSQRCKGTGRRHNTAQTKPGWGQSVDARRLRQQGRDETNNGGRRSACDDPRWVRPRSSSAVVPTVTRHHHTPPAAHVVFAAPLLSSG